MNAKRRILIVDDDVDFVYLLSARLQANDYDVEVAFDAIRAISQAQQFRPHMIILDIRLPGGNGFRLYRAFRGSHHTALTPIIFVTGFDQADNAQQSHTRETFEQLGTPFLIKPFEAEDLIEKVRSVLGGRGAPQERAREMRAVQEAIGAFSRV
ncbi:MAG: response regulator [Phycisphaerae bacterium]|nr:response regulator [Phycisphaerae bacterium]